MVLAVVAQTAVVLGVVGSLAALLTPRHLQPRRRRWWITATIGFVISGVLSIASIGFVLLGLAGATALAALHAEAGAQGEGRGSREG